MILVNIFIISLVMIFICGVKKIVLNIRYIKSVIGKVVL